MTTKTKALAVPGISTVNVSITGISPLLSHNGRTVDPCDIFARKLKELSGNRKKTDEDYMRIAEVEFSAGLYLSDNGRPSIPGINIESMLIAAAKKSKDGPRAKAGLFVPQEYIEIDYTGPKNAEGLWEDERFRHRARVKIQSNSVMRVRPMFPQWNLKIPVQVVTDVLNPREVEQFFTVAGSVIGLGDWRPRYGRFIVDSFDED